MQTSIEETVPKAIEGTKEEDPQNNDFSANTDNDGFINLHPKTCQAGTTERGTVSKNDGAQGISLDENRHSSDRIRLGDTSTEAIRNQFNRHRQPIQVTKDEEFSALSEEYGAGGTAASGIEIQDAIEHYKKEAEKASKRNDTLTARLYGLNHSVVRYRDENQDLKRKVHDLEMQLSEQTATMSPRAEFSADKETFENLLEESRPTLGNSGYGVDVRSGSFSDRPPPPHKRKKRISESSERKRCTRCFEEEPIASTCVYHKAAPQPVEIWNKQLGSLENLQFWSCCGKVGRAVPVGCTTMGYHRMS